MLSARQCPAVAARRAVTDVYERRQMMEIRNKLVNWRRRRSADHVSVLYTRRPACERAVSRTDDVDDDVIIGCHAQRRPEAALCLFIRVSRPSAVCISCNREAVATLKYHVPFHLSSL